MGNSDGMIWALNWHIGHIRSRKKRHIYNRLPMNFYPAFIYSGKRKHLRATRTVEVLIQTYKKETKRHDIYVVPQNHKQYTIQ